MKLQGQIAIVTGAASGFGAEIARQYIAEGAQVALADIDAAGVHALAAVFLASADAAFISGVEFPVDGARTV